jgi:hypothetical protein
MGKGPGAITSACERSELSGMFADTNRRKKRHIKKGLLYSGPRLSRHTMLHTTTAATTMAAGTPKAVQFTVVDQQPGHPGESP